MFTLSIESPWKNDICFLLLSSRKISVHGLLTLLTISAFCMYVESSKECENQVAAACSKERLALPVWSDRVITVHQIHSRNVSFNIFHSLSVGYHLCGCSKPCVIFFNYQPLCSKALYPVNFPIRKIHETHFIIPQMIYISCDHQAVKGMRFITIVLSIEQ